MPILDRPGLLWAGLLLALLPPLLHLITRRPRERRPLPTARFLAPDARTTVWLQRRPTEVPLLLLRSLFLLLLGAAAAGPAWPARGEATLDLVLLDRALGAGGWAAAVDSARAVLLPQPGPARGDLVLFDTAAAVVPAREVTPALFDSLAALAVGPHPGPADYGAALRAARGSARARPGADSLRLTLVTRPRWEGWSEGLGPLRAAAWPGAIRLVAVGGTDGPEAAPPPPAPRARAAAVLAAEGGGAYAAAALAALGWAVADATAEPALYLVLAPEVAAGGDLLARAREGAVVVVAGEPPAGPLGDALPWETAEESSLVAAAPAALVLDAGPSLGGAAGRVPGRVRRPGRLLAAWEDGRPAAAAAPEGAGCLVFLATELEAGALPLSPAFPLLLDRLARGCEPAAPPAGGAALPLDRGALALLEGREMPAVVAAATLGAVDPGRRLDRWLLLAALGVALAEAGLAYRRGRSG
jgi:hypothetical protein